MTYTVRPISDRTPFTGSHQRSPFDSSWSATEQLLLREVRQLKGKYLVVEVDVPESQIRNDGRLYARAQAATPATRVAFESKHGPLTYATDRFSTWQDNVRAIALGLESLRRVDRYGITERGEQYAGFKALPAGRAMPASHMTCDEAIKVLAAQVDPALAFVPLDRNELASIYRSARDHPRRPGQPHRAPPPHLRVRRWRPLPLPVRHPPPTHADLARPHRHRSRRRPAVTITQSITASDADQRPAAGHCNYPGDVTPAIARDLNVPKGPNDMGELMWPVTAEYDDEVDRTRVGYTLIPPTTGGAA